MGDAYVGGTGAIGTVAATGQAGRVVRRRPGGVAVIARGSGVRCRVLEEQVRPATEGERTQWMIAKPRR